MITTIVVVFEMVIIWNKKCDIYQNKHGPFVLFFKENRSFFVAYRSVLVLPKFSKIVWCAGLDFS